MARGGQVPGHPGQPPGRRGRPGDPGRSRQGQARRLDGTTGSRPARRDSDPVPVLAESEDSLMMISATPAPGPGGRIIISKAGST